MHTENKPMFSFENIQTGDVLQVLVQMTSFLLVHMIGRDQYQNPQSTMMQTLRESIKNASLSDEQNRFVNAMIETCETSLRVFSDGVRGMN